MPAASLPLADQLAYGIHALACTCTCSHPFHATRRQPAVMGLQHLVTPPTHRLPLSQPQAFNWDLVPAAAVACGFEATRPFVAYRWRSEVSEVVATASSCGHALGEMRAVMHCCALLCIAVQVACSSGS